MADANNPQAGAGRPLPKKEADLFRSVVKQYEMKMYKKALKQADTILKKFPNHGETLAMKGLTLNYMNRGEEAHELVKLGLRNDMRSHVCWHVYGLLHRHDHNYNEAIKAYKQALRIDPNNLQILRDLSMLQIQMRDLHGFAVTRNTLLTLKPNAKINWMAFALARHLNGDLRGAVKVVDTYMGTLTEGSSELGRCYESSELALYKNMILEEIPNNHKEGLAHLNVCEGIVVDRGAWMMKRAEYQLKLGDYVAVRESVRAMFDRGMTESYRVHSLLMCAVLELDDPVCEEALKLSGTQTVATMMPLTSEQVSKLLNVYSDDLVGAFHRSHAMQRIPLSLLDESKLLSELDARCRKDLSKGVPSLCAELVSYVWMEKDGRLIRPSDPVDVKANARFQLLESMADGYIASLESTKKLSATDENEADPSCLPWAYFLRAGLHEKAGEYQAGISLLDKCLSVDGSIVDVFELKAQLLKSAGNISAAVECLDKGRELDLQDRYINNQTAMYMLQAGQDDEAMKRVSLFTRHEGNPESNLYDMQCSWYELELAASLERKKEWGRSLKKYSAVVQHFRDIIEDQFDFHSYCLRKVTLRAYVSVLRFEDNVLGESYYRQAAAGIIRIYLHLADNPPTDEGAEPDYSKMTPAEKKKAKAIARKKKKAAEKKETDLRQKEAANQNGGKSKNTGNKNGKTPTVDKDPLGKELLAKDPLDEARKYASEMARFAPRYLGSWLQQYDVATRRKKPLMALQALCKARAIDDNDGALFSRLVDFGTKLSSFDILSPTVKQIIDEEVPKLFDDGSVADFVKKTVASVKSDILTPLGLRCSVARAVAEVLSWPVEEACQIVLDGGLNARGVTVTSCREALMLLTAFGPDANQFAEQWKKDISARFPMASFE